VYLLGGGIKLGAVALTPVSLYAEAITRGAREHVQMNMEDLLKGGLAIGEKQVDSLAWQARSIQRSGQTMCYPEEVGAQVLIKGIQGMHMRAGEDEQMA
jgi:hypothetical protein